MRTGTRRTRGRPTGIRTTNGWKTTSSNQNPDKTPTLTARLLYVAGGVDVVVDKTNEVPSGEAVVAAADRMHGG